MTSDLLIIWNLVSSDMSFGNKDLTRYPKGEAGECIQTMGALVVFNELERVNE